MSVPEKSSTQTARGFAKSRCLCEIHRVKPHAINYDRREDDEEDRVDPGIIRLSWAPSVDGDHPALMLRFALTPMPVRESMSVGPEVKFALLF